MIGPRPDTADRPPEVSVIIPTFERAHLIGETLRSVAGQEFRDWECIVVDDGSTDGTARVVEPFLRGDARFRYLWQENASAAAARTRGLSVARGRFIAFLDSDDVWPPDSLAWRVRWLREHPELAVVYGDTAIFHGGDPEGGAVYLADIPRKPSGNVLEEFLERNYILSPGAGLIRGDLMRLRGRIDQALRLSEDWDMWLRLSRLGPFRHVPGVALYYRSHPGNKSHRNLGESYRCVRRIVLKHAKALPKERREAVRRRAFRTHRETFLSRAIRQAWDAEALGDWGTARRTWRALAAAEPGLLARRDCLASLLWSFIPGDRPPFWRAAWFRPIRHRFGIARDALCRGLRAVREGESGALRR